MVRSFPNFLQRQLVLGLDLQGGSHILLEVDSKAVQKEKLETLRDDVRRVLRNAPAIGYEGLTIQGRPSRSASASQAQCARPCDGCAISRSP